MLYSKIQLLIDFINNKNNSVMLNQDDMNELIKICKNHSLLPILYKACLKYNISLNEAQNAFLKKQYNISILKEATQDCELHNILKELSNNSVKCMPLKGSILKNLYPSPELRTMCDIDILFDDSQTKKVKRIMTKLGYKCDKSGGTDDEYKKPPFMNVEMHRIMVDGNFEMIAAYYSNIWEIIKPINNNKYIYEMSNEDFYIHMIAHIARHYAVGGIGIRFVFDVWLFLQKNSDNLNFEYINHELDKISLLMFANNFRNLSIKWFEGQETTALEEDMTSYIFNSGTHGTISHEQSVKLILGDKGIKNFKHSKIKYILKLIFPGFKYMRNRNHILKKYPILLPYFYIQRILFAVFKRKKLVIQTIEGLDKFNEEYSKKIVKLHVDSGIKKMNES